MQINEDSRKKKEKRKIACKKEKKLHVETAFMPKGNVNRKTHLQLPLFLFFKPTPEK